MADFIVSNSNNSGEGSLRGAIALANENAGSDKIIVEVADINLNSEIQISDSVEIIGNDVVIAQQGENEGILYIDDLINENFLDVSLSNLTLTGGDNLFPGGAVQNWENLNLDTVTVRDNKGTSYGAGIYSYGGDVSVTNSLFEDNTTVEDEDGNRSGGAIFLEDGSLIINSSIFQRNDAGTQTIGVSYGQLDISNSEIINNIGSGISTLGAKTAIDNVLVEGNSRTGAYGLGGSLWTILNSTFARNNGAQYGGGLAIIDSLATIENTLIDGNSAPEGAGAIFIASSAGVKIYDSVVTNNNAPEGSGIFGIDNSTSATISNTYFSNNTEGEQIDGFSLTYEGNNIDNQYGIEPTKTVGYTAPQSEQPVAEEPIVEEPAVEQPVAEEPVTEEPAVEQPVTEEPAVEQPVTEEPIVEEPAVEQPVTEEPAVEEPVLNLETSEVHRFYQYEKGFHFYTSDVNESNVIQEETISGNLAYDYEGESYKALNSNKDSLSGEIIEGAQEVYRFFNSNTGAHLFTMDEVEKDYIESTLDNYSYEGVAYYAFEEQHESIDTIPIYRMYNGQTDTHLLTVDNNEIDYIQENLPHFSTEGDNGIAFYVMEI